MNDNSEFDDYDHLEKEAMNYDTDIVVPEDYTMPKAVRAASIFFIGVVVLSLLLVFLFPI
jgi:hypothetical protein